MTSQSSGVSEQTSVDDPNAPQALVARLFMEHKGLGTVEPYSVEKVEGEPVWYFWYRLPEGVLELEVCWDGEEWDTVVTSFTLASEDDD